MLVELRRQSSDGLPPFPSMLVNPANVSAVFESTRSPGTVIVRMNDGRGFVINESYASVMAKLQATNVEAEVPLIDDEAEAESEVMEAEARRS